MELQERMEKLEWKVSELNKIFKDFLEAFDRHIREQKEKEENW
jgi:hypothetical protein